MKSTTSKSNLLTALGLLLALPTGYFIFISILKYWLNINGPFDSLQPFLERLGSKESFGWNINLLILFGPVLAFLLTIFQVVRIKWNFTEEEFHFDLTVQRKWFPMLVAVFSIGTLAILFFYLLGENCNC
jgi:hypothetical protein